MSCPRRPCFLDAAGINHQKREAPVHSLMGANLMLTALILVCSLASVPDLAACTRDNALHVMQVPEAFANPITCLMHGQAYLAGTTIGQELAANEAVKVVCTRSRAALLSVEPATQAQAEPGR
jgi:hypothetical protein